MYLSVQFTYSFYSAEPGHILLTCPSAEVSVLISLVSSLFLRPFLARNEECGLSNTDCLSVNLQNSSSLTQACISLILQPVASRRRKAV